MKHVFRTGEVIRTIEVRPGEGEQRVFRIDDREEALSATELAPGVWRYSGDDRSFVAYVAKDAADRTWVHVGGQTVCLEPERAGARQRRRDAASGDLEAPMPGRIVRVEAEVGASVAAGAAIVVLEAMKMEHTLRAPFAGRVAWIGIRTGEMVKAGQELAKLDPL